MVITQKLAAVIQRVAYFLHITDGEGQLDIVDLSLIGVVVKLLLAPNLDWQAVCAMLPLLMSQAHSNHLDYLKTKLAPNQEASK